MSKELTVERVLELAEEAVAEYGADHKAIVCDIYDEDDCDERGGEKTPMCIVGVILHKVVGPEVFQNVDAGFVEGPAESVGVVVDAPSKRTLEALQQYQDGAEVYDADNEILLPGDYTIKRPWGDALEFVKANLEAIVNHKTGEEA